MDISVLREDVVDDLAYQIGRAKVAAGVALRHVFVVEAE
jgi:hypothetical protein